MNTSKRLLAIPMVAALSLSGASAYAGVIKQGSDTSYTKNTNTRAVACDHESDGHGVHVDAGLYTENGYSIRADDPDGAGGSCGVSQSTNGIKKHRTVEEVSWKPDYKSGWHYHG